LGGHTRWRWSNPDSGASGTEALDALVPESLRAARLPREQLPGTFGEGRARPGPVQIVECRLQRPATRDAEVDRGCEASHNRCCRIQLGEHREDRRPVGLLVLAKLARVAIDEREECDGVAPPKSTQRLSTGSENRGEHEVQA
jgi:hypothetical protein